MTIWLQHLNVFTYVLSSENDTQNSDNLKIIPWQISRIPHAYVLKAFYLAKI